MDGSNGAKTTRSSGMDKLKKPRKVVRRAIRSSGHRKPRLTARDIRRYRELLVNLSAQFITIPSDQVDIRIVDGLRQLVETLGVQRSSLAVLDEQDRLRITHSYAARGYRPMPQALLDQEFPWLAKVLREGRTVRLNAHTALPTDAKPERELTRASGIRAVITLPFSVGGIPVCVLGVCSKVEREWPDEMIPYLQQAGEIFANAIARKRKDEQLKRAEVQLEHLARVSTMGQLAGSIANEVNQPLCAIVSNAQATLGFLSDTQPEIEQAIAAIKDIIRDGKRSSEIIGRTNAMLRRHAVAFTTHELNHLVTDSLPLIERYATLRRVELKTSFASNLPRLHCDAVQLQQVLVNLIMNAVEAIPPNRDEKGCVSIETSRNASNTGVRVSVSDNGTGLSPELARRVFEPFYTSKLQGLGMGLAISRTIVEAHGGTLWAEPNTVRGACFVFELPTQQEINDVKQSSTGHGRRRR
jgi:C4-dicarboxylate-specific signal transduction histidine kinase